MLARNKSEKQEKRGRGETRILLICADPHNLRESAAYFSPPGVVERTHRAFFPKRESGCKRRT